MLKTFLFLSPIFVFQDWKVSFARGLFFIAGSLTLWIVGLGIKPVREFKGDGWLALFLILALARSFFGEYLGQGSYFNFWMAFSGFIYIFCGALLFHTVYCHADNVKQFITPIATVCTLNLILSRAQMIGHDFMWAHTNDLGHLCGFMETPAQLGQYSAMTVPALCIISPFLALIPVLTLFMSKSVTPIVSFIAGLGFISWQIGRKGLIIFLAIAALIAGVMNFSYVRMKWGPRPVMWAKTFETAVKKPFIGWGYRSFDCVIWGEKFPGGHRINAGAFNDYLHTAQELGFPTLFAGIMFIAGMFRRFMRAKKTLIMLCLMASVVIVLVNMLGQGTIRFASIAGTFLVLLAFLNIEIDKGLANDKRTDS